MEYYDNDVSVHSVYIQTVFYGLCLIIKFILPYLILCKYVMCVGMWGVIDQDLWIMELALETLHLLLLYFQMKTQTAFFADMAK